MALRLFSPHWDASRPPVSQQESPCPRVRAPGGGRSPPQLPGRAAPLLELLSRSVRVCVDPGGKGGARCDHMITIHLRSPKTKGAQKRRGEEEGKRPRGGQRDALMAGTPLSHSTFMARVCVSVRPGGPSPPERLGPKYAPLLRLLLSPRRGCSSLHLL
ncbi:unnamed protein product [Pleuronectes platessa]|uniref:Uncharacterized protein n=1 Tax=Pleuronectes platessa TaxID=8262 RepID=A0A9N7VK90_PLEPL|nr:unnamed protein product [Pleuronectes platessa]